MLKQEHDNCKAELQLARACVYVGEYGDVMLTRSSEEEGAYTKYSQSISKNFTTAFLSALPRELRDHVYSYLWDDEDIVRQTKRSVREYAWSYRMPEFCAPPYVQPDHVGQVVAEELALSIYKKAFGTKLNVTVSAGHLHKFLAANPLKSTLKPADCIKALTIEWYPNEYSVHDVARSCRNLSQHNFPEPIPVKLILGNFRGDGPVGLAIGNDLTDQISVFRPAYDALVERKCPVTIESLHGELLNPKLIAG